MKPVVGNWYVEADKGVHLYCAAVDDSSVGLSYHPDSPIAVRVTTEDFPIFFVHNIKTALRNLLDVIGAPPERNDAGDVTLEHHQRLGEAVANAERAFTAEKQ
jgi:hypothetical protein